MTASALPQSLVLSWCLSTTDWVRLVGFLILAFWLAIKATGQKKMSQEIMGLSIFWPLSSGPEII